MRYLKFAFCFALPLGLLACSGGDPDPTINLYQYPGSEADDQVVIDPVDFEMEYRFDCEPLNCETQCRLEGDGDWFDCQSPYRLDQHSERLEIEEGYLRFEVRAYHDEEYSAAAEADVLVLFDFEFDLDDAHPFDPSAADPSFYFPDEYSASCSRDDCDVSCFWEAEDLELTEVECSVDEPFELSYPDDELAHVDFLLEACANDFGGRQNDRHCKGPKTYRFYPPPPAFVDIDAGRRHTCGLVEDGSLWCWGQNNAGQVGVGTTDGEIAVPTKVLNRDWADISTGGEHSCAINEAGQLYCWGNNSSGQLGFSPQNPTQAEKVDDGPWSTVSAGHRHTCAIRADDGTSDANDLRCWGESSSGRLGNPSATTGTDMYSVALPGGATQGWIDVSAGDEHTCAIAHRSGGGQALYCWGNASQGRLGNGADAGSFDSAQEVIGDLGFMNTQQVSAYTGHTCAVATDGGDRSTYCWGQGTRGRLGTASDNHRSAPRRIAQGEDQQEDGPNNYDNYISITTGANHSCGIHEDGRLFCWGENFLRQLGAGIDVDSAAVPRIADVDARVTFAQVVAGDEHSCALDTNDMVYCWGDSSDGQLGIGTDDSGDYIRAQTPRRISWPQGEFIPEPS